MSGDWPGVSLIKGVTVQHWPKPIGVTGSFPTLSENAGADIDQHGLMGKKKTDEEGVDEMVCNVG
jgi:hypothetical protein